MNFNIKFYKILKFYKQAPISLVNLSLITLNIVKLSVSLGILKFYTLI
jgi:hypothetical protein